MEEEEERFVASVEMELNKLAGELCLGVNKASVGEVSTSHDFSQVGPLRCCIS